ncbi:MAG: Unknown protein [uncultured Sulfurovum sp.]|uniref:Nitric oxide-responding transcriptional regulator Dnr (Crp/Fnr family) n=1 Tax=uncultured Sulfurovum sp. TaxID=269237 RepID=A0A6S6T8Z6_9BACT|nr:MAG: Unknown protein [uncultured Sulfurovum sp.]
MNKLYTITVVLFLTSTLFVNASTYDQKRSELINLVSKQLSLAKKVSSNYVNFQNDLKNNQKRQIMLTSIQDFHSNHLKLIQNRNHTKPIKSHLDEVDRIWIIAHELSKEKKHPKMITSTMNDIHKELQEIRKLYKKNIANN